MKNRILMLTLVSLIACASLSAQAVLFEMPKTETLIPAIWCWGWGTPPTQTSPAKNDPGRLQTLAFPGDFAWDEPKKSPSSIQPAKKPKIKTKKKGK